MIRQSTRDHLVAADRPGGGYLFHHPEAEPRPLSRSIVVWSILVTLGSCLHLAGNETMPRIFAGEVGLVIVGTSCLFMSWMFSRQPEACWTDRYPNSRVVTKRSAVLLFALMGILFGMWGGWPLVGDYLFPRYTVEGTIQDLHPEYRARGFYDFIVRIGGRDYRVPRRTFRQFSVGETVRAEVGRGSGYLFNIETARPAHAEQM